MTYAETQKLVELVNENRVLEAQRLEWVAEMTRHLDEARVLDGKIHENRIRQAEILSAVRMTMRPQPNPDDGIPTMGEP